MKEWMSAADLAITSIPKTVVEALGLRKWPATQQGVNGLAKRLGWIGRQSGGSARAWEYRVSALPVALQKALARKALTTHSAVPAQLSLDLPDATDLKDYQRGPMEARAALLAEIDRLVLTMGISQGKAITTLVDLAARHELAPELQRLVPVANARANAGRTLTRATIYNWLKARDTAAGNVVALAPKGVEEGHIPPWAATFVKLFGRPANPSIPMVLEDLWPEGEARPSPDQARRFLKRLSALDRNRGRVGPRDLRKYQIYTARDVSELWPGAVFCGDGHTFKAEVAHPIHGRPFRPEITMIVDVFTRRIVGWSTALAENTSSVADALRHAVTTATACDMLYYDNGSGAKNAAWDDATTGLAGRLGITKEHSRAYNSQARGVIERRNSTILHRAAKLLPTYVGQDMDREARQQAYKITRKDIRETGSSRLLPSWAEFIALLDDQIAAANARECEGLPKIADHEAGRRRHMSPDEAWAKAIADGWTPDPIPEAEARDLFRPVEIRKTRRGLVDLFGNEYFGGHTLEALHDEQVRVSYDIHDATKVWIRDMSGRFICEAEWGGHKTSYVPVSKARLAQAARVAGKIGRLEAHLDTARAELTPQLDYQPAPTFTAPTLVVDADCVTVAAQAPDAPAQQIAAPNNGGRPLFSDDVEWARWLVMNPDKTTGNDRELLRLQLRNSSFLTLLDWEGVDVATLRELSQRTEAA